MKLLLRYNVISTVHAFLLPYSLLGVYFFDGNLELFNAICEL